MQPSEHSMYVFEILSCFQYSFIVLMYWAGVVLTLVLWRAYSDMYKRWMKIFKDLFILMSSWSCQARVVGDILNEMFSLRLLIFHFRNCVMIALKLPSCHLFWMCKLIFFANSLWTCHSEALSRFWIFCCMQFKDGWDLCGFIKNICAKKYLHISVCELGCRDCQLLLPLGLNNCWPGFWTTTSVLQLLIVKPIVKLVLCSNSLVSSQSPLLQLYI